LRSNVGQVNGEDDINRFYLKTNEIKVSRIERMISIPSPMLPTPTPLPPRNKNTGINERMTTAAKTVRVLQEQQSACRVTHGELALKREK
jgi:hypothetical protein